MRCRKIGSIERPEVTLKRCTEHACIHQAGHLVQQAMLLDHIPGLKQRSRKHHLQEIVRLFCLDGRMSMTGSSTRRQ
jgi:CO dehydrogenase/acetyl-CoA synthase gamma subunit (corrinoid Fe-S protein)